MPPRRAELRIVQAAQAPKEAYDIEVESEFVQDIPYEMLQQGGYVGPRFTGVFFFEDVFWRVAIPLVYGRVAVNPVNALRIMPAKLKQRLCSNTKALREYLLLWSDCVDYDMGHQDSHAHFTVGSFLGEMIESTEREIASVITDLCQQRPNSKAMHSTRDATEKALRAFLAHCANLTHDRAKTHFGHKLDRLVQEVERQRPQSPMMDVANKLDVFAPYDSRYSSTSYTRPQLWRAYQLCQFTAAEMVRSITGRNQRSTVQSLPVFSDAWRLG